MKRMQRTIWIPLVLLVAGCQPWPQGPSGSDSALTGPRPETVPRASYLKNTVRGQNEQSDPSAVDSAMVWAKKYTEATEKIMQLEKDRRALVEENSKKADRIADIEKQLAQAQKEIDDANALLIRYNKELAQWKAQVLDYRDEIRKGLDEVIAKQIDIIRILGGELDTTASPTTRPSVASNGSRP